MNSGPGIRVTGNLVPYRTSHRSSPSDLDYIQVKINEKAKQLHTQRWIDGMSWGIIFWEHGGGTGSILIIRLSVKNTPTVPVGPNTVLGPQRPPRPRPTPSPTKPPTPVPPTSPDMRTPNPPPQRMADQLVALLDLAFQFLNASSPNATDSCWLCYDTAPPFYEAIGFLTNVSSSLESSDEKCR